MKGLIYRAYNIISGKSYIGQTTTALAYRTALHYSAAKTNKGKYHFVNALRFYNKEDWQWSIVEDNIEQELLNEKEINYIKQFDTFENGYNGNYGGTTVKVAKKHSFYHKDYGHVEATVKEICERLNSSKPSITNLKNNKVNRVKGWVMSSNVDNYESIVNPPKKVKPSIVKPVVEPEVYTIVHKKLGELTGTKEQLSDMIGVGKERIRQLIFKNKT